jgi:hypothetical protein
MMGERRVQQEALFYEFSFERHVPETHLLRQYRPLCGTRWVKAAVGALLQ